MIAYRLTKIKRILCSTDVFTATGWFSTLQEINSAADYSVTKERDTIPRGGELDNASEKSRLRCMIILLTAARISRSGAARKRDQRRPEWDAQPFWPAELEWRAAGLRAERQYPRSIRSRYRAAAKPASSHDGCRNRLGKLAEGTHPRGRIRR